MPVSDRPEFFCDSYQIEAHRGPSAHEENITKKLISAALVALLLATTMTLATTGVASAAASCGSKTTSQEYGVNVPIVGYKKTVTHSAKTRSCENDVNITVNNMDGPHDCSKTLIAFANSITKKESIGRTGGPEASNVYECNFSGGLIWKGVGIGVTRNLYIKHRVYINNGALWVSNSTSTSCC